MKIEKARYEGYLWRSDSSEPQVIDGEFELATEDAENPFIVEGMLYDADRALSIMIKYVDGHYLVSRHEVTEAEARNAETYIGKRMQGRNLRMVQLWKDEPDDSCLGMTVQRPGAMVFVGFQK